MSSKASRITSDGMEYHTSMKLTNGYIQKDDTGVIIPQTIYGRAGDEWLAHRKLPSVHFAVDGDKKLGIRLTHLLQSSMVSTAGALSSLQPLVDSPAMHLAGIIICWPGQASWLSPLDKFAVLRLRGGVALPELGRCIAEKMSDFLKQHVNHNAHQADNPWETTRFSLDSLYLLQLDNVGPGLWQPVLSGVPNAVAVGR